MASKASESSFVISVLRVICIGMFVRLHTYVRTLLGSYVRKFVRAFVGSYVRTFLITLLILIIVSSFITIPFPLDDLDFSKHK